MNEQNGGLYCQIEEHYEQFRVRSQEGRVAQSLQGVTKDVNEVKSSLGGIKTALLELAK